MRSTISALLVSAALLLIPNAVEANGDNDYVASWEVAGPFVASVETGPGCVDSPIFMCTHGLLSGDLEGTYEFSFDSMSPAPTLEHPNRMVYTGRSVITLQNGARLFADDEGEMYPQDAAGTYFVTRVSVFAGENVFEGVTGWITASGEIDFVNNLTQGIYVGELDVVCPHDNSGKQKQECRDLGPKQ